MINNYNLTITKQINHGKLQSEIENQIETLLGFHNVGQDFVFDFNGAFDNLLLEQIIINHDPIDLIADEADRYIERIQDGLMMSINLMAELRVSSVQLNLPREVNKYIEDKLNKVKINIDRGWWVTALEELESTIVEGYFTQELYDRLHVAISDYILINYPTSY